VTNVKLNREALNSRLSSCIFITGDFKLKTKLDKLREIVARDGGKAKAEQTCNEDITTRTSTEICVFDLPFADDSTRFIEAA
jgi:hypothetical protein